MAVLGALDKPWYTGITGNHNPDPDPLVAILIIVAVVCFIVLLWH